MQVIQFPKREKWNGKGLKKKHLLQLSKDIKRQAAVDEAKVLILRLDHKLGIALLEVRKLKEQHEKARLDYFKLLEDAE